MLRNYQTRPFTLGQSLFFAQSQQVRVFSTQLDDKDYFARDQSDAEDMEAEIVADADSSSPTPFDDDYFAADCK